MDKRMVAALLSSIICEIAIILLLLLTPSPLPLSSPSSFSSLWPLLMEIFHSSHAAASFLHHEKDEEEEEEEEVGGPTSKRRRTTFIANTIMEQASFRSTFRISPSTFEFLCTQTEPFLQGYGSPNIPISHQLAMGLFRLATGLGYESVAQRFSSTEPTARLCTKRLVKILCKKFGSWVAFPPPWALPKISADFETIGGLPNCCGAIDCTRFDFTAMGPAANGGKTHKGLFAMQIVVDSSSRVLNIVAGFSGDKGDSRVLKSSSIYKDVEQGRMLDSGSVCLNGVRVNQYFVGDNGYPLLPWLMVPYTEPLADLGHEDFNLKHNLMHQVVRKALVRIKKWGVLNKGIEEEDLRVCVGCVVACVILHNIVLGREEEGFEEDYCLDDESSQYYRDDNDEEFLIEKKGAVIRNALALRARELQNSVHETDPFQ